VQVDAGIDREHRLLDRSAQPVGAGVLVAARLADAFEKAEAVAAPIYDMAAAFADPHLRQRDSFVEADGVPMQGLVARLSRTPGAVRWAGRPLAADDPPSWT
jgi:crotonobetainyl-CoA:carnitine CoA-transferase CaiB-like acyl-CoA transferase